jgi:hypothetical protein
MTEPIYGIHFLRRKEAWFTLSPEKQQELSSKWSKLPTSCGTKNVLNMCKALTGEWEFFGVYEYPDLATRERLVNAYEAADFFRYFDYKLDIGKHPTGPGGSFKVD